MEPIFFKPIYKNVIWGGSNISKVLKRNVEGEDIGESWELSAHPNGLSIVENGEFEGKSLYELFENEEIKSKIFGKKARDLSRFPILVKFIDANDKLSIQVHPNDEYAMKNENDSGKSEVWYVMHCKPDAKIIYGFKENVEEENLNNILDNIEDKVRYIDVKKGDFIEIPAGTIHAIMDGLLICEVQQSSDVTYRVYDWNRTDKNGKQRELHKEKALEVINLNNVSKVHNYENIEKNTKIYVSDIFNVDIIRVKESEENISKEESFFVYTVIEGNRKINVGKFCKRNKNRRYFPNTIKSWRIQAFRRFEINENLVIN